MSNYPDGFPDADEDGRPEYVQPVWQSERGTVARARNGSLWLSGGGWRPLDALPSDAVRLVPVGEVDALRRAVWALCLLVAAKDARRTLGGYPAPAIDPEWAGGTIEPPATAADPAMPPLRGRLRCLGCGHMWNRHARQGSATGCHVLVEVNHVDGVATGLELCGCREQRP